MPPRTRKKASRVNRAWRPRGSHDFGATREVRCVLRERGCPKATRGRTQTVKGDLSAEVESANRHPLFDESGSRRPPEGRTMHRSKRAIRLLKFPHDGRRHSRTMGPRTFVEVEAYVSGPNLIFCFTCPGCGESITLPRQSVLGTVGSSDFLCTSAWPILFLCSRYSSISTVSSSAVHLATELLVDKTRRLNSLWAIDGDCRLENCGKRHSLYTYSLREADPGLILHTFMSVNPSIPCLGGHPARFHRDHLTISRLVTS